MSYSLQMDSPKTHALTLLATWRANGPLKFKAPSPRPLACITGVTSLQLFVLTLSVYDGTTVFFKVPLVGTLSAE
jgi:hypothetical protein